VPVLANGDASDAFPLMPTIAMTGRKQIKRPQGMLAVDRNRRPLSRFGETDDLLRGCFNVLRKFIQNRLPALALLFDRILCFRIESDAHFYATFQRSELDRTDTVAE
jgi:hypothetical protein